MNKLTLIFFTNWNIRGHASSGYGGRVEGQPLKPRRETRHVRHVGHVGRCGHIGGKGHVLLLLLLLRLFEGPIEGGRGTL